MDGWTGVKHNAPDYRHGGIKKHFVSISICAFQFMISATVFKDVVA